MSPAVAPRGRSTPPGMFGWRSWVLWQAPRAVIALILTTDVLTFMVGAAALASGSPHWSSTVRLLILLSLAVAFEEASRTVDRLRLKISSGVYVDMTSVWLLAGAIVLPATYTVALVVLVRTHMWVRHQRKNNMRAYRQIYTAASMMLASLACGTLVHHVVPAADKPTSALVSALIVGVGIGIYALINTSLVSGGIYLATRPERAVTALGTWDENLLEFATLCLGGLTALAVLHEPWLTLLALPPMFTLQRSALVRQLEQAASTDSKTGLLNAVAWEQLAARELSRAAREQKPAGVLIIDLDYFKAVNDIHGHLAGDVVLREVGKCLTRELRDYDTVGRFGGEEFVAILSGADSVNAMETAERVRQRIAELRPSALIATKSSEADTPLSASIGVACYPEHGTEIDQLLRAADAGLYRAKRAGRNRVELADGPATDFERMLGG